MRHGIQTRKFGRVKKQRVALMRSLALSLIKHESIKTTEAKAKSLRPFIEKLVTNAKKGDTVAGRRLIVSKLGQKSDEVAKLFEDIAKRYEKRAGGYTRVTKLSPRNSDASPMAIIEFV